MQKSRWVLRLALSACLAIGLGMGCGTNSNDSPSDAGNTSARALPTTMLEAQLAAGPEYAFVQSPWGASTARTTLPAQVWIDRDGLHIERDDGPGATISLRLKTIARSREITVASPATPKVDRNRATVDHGVVEEWWLNGPLGLEHGFTIAERLSASVDDALEINIAVEGSVVATDGLGGVRFARKGFSAGLRYNGLAVHDANGAAIPAEMLVRGTDVVLRIDERSAPYPIYVDPLLWIEEPKLVNSDSNDGTHFGDRLALGDDIAFIATPFQLGNINVFERATSWSETQIIDLPVFELGDMAVDGDTLIVGDIQLNGFGTGGAYVFEPNGAGVWSQTAVLDPMMSQGTDRAGAAVAVSGDEAFVGAPGNNKIFHFRRDAMGVWTELANFDAADTGMDDRFGCAAAIDGDYAIIGARRDDDLAANNGAAYIFERDSNGDWIEVQKLLASDGELQQNFGVAVDIAGDYAIVGADLNAFSSAENGAAYIFERDGNGTWNQVYKATPSGPADDGFGYDVAMGDSYALVGTEFGGTADVYERDPSGTWTLAQQFVPEPAIARFGRAVAAYSNDILIGAPGDTPSGTFSGSAFIYEGSGPEGGLCSADDWCDNGVCEDGVCCENVCASSVNPCLVCSVAKGSYQDGKCDTAPQGYSCRPEAGTCDSAEVCDGTSPKCPDDSILPAGTICREAEGPCDEVEECTGTAVCPDDAKVSAGTSCRAAAGTCDAEESCDGVSDACPEDAKQPAATTCRAAADVCDTAEECDGTSDDCPEDAVLEQGSVCRGSAGVCDANEVCDGVGVACPTDESAEDGTPCDANGTCQDGSCQTGDGAGGSTASGANPPPGTGEVPTGCSVQHQPRNDSYPWLAVFGVMVVVGRRRVRR